MNKLAAYAAASTLALAPAAAEVAPAMAQDQPASYDAALKAYCVDNAQASETQFTVSKSFNGLARVAVTGTEAGLDADCKDVAERQKVAIDMVEVNSKNNVVRNITQNPYEVTGSQEQSLAGKFTIKACKKGVKSRKIALRERFTISGVSGVKTIKTPAVTQRCK